MVTVSVSQMVVMLVVGFIIILIGLFAFAAHLLYTVWSATQPRGGSGVR